MGLTMTVSVGSIKKFISWPNKQEAAILHFYYYSTYIAFIFATLSFLVK